jgi:hypothetical protein
MKEPHEHPTAAGAPGASGPGEQGYEGEATLGDEGAAAGAEAFTEPFGRPDAGPDGDAELRQRGREAPGAGQAGADQAG